MSTIYLWIELWCMLYGIHAHTMKIEVNMAFVKAYTLRGYISIIQNQSHDEGV